MCMILPREKNAHIRELQDIIFCFEKINKMYALLEIVKHKEKPSEECVLLCKAKQRTFPNEM